MTSRFLPAKILPFPVRKSTNSMTTQSRSRRAVCSRVADSALPHWDGETERAVCGMRLDAKGLSHWQCEGKSVNFRFRTKNKASRAVSVDISLGTARSTSSIESVTPQTSVHFKCALLYVNEMRFTADRRSIRRYPLEKDLYICKKIRVVWDARAYGLRIFICEEP